MPELPDIDLYIHALKPRVVDQPLERLRITSPFLLRSVEPPVAEIEGKLVQGISRLGKRIVFAFENELFAILHLMIAGRLKWRPRKAPIPRRQGLAAFDFPTGSLLLTEAGSKRRASLFIVRGTDALAFHDPGGAEPLELNPAGLHEALTREVHTLKRALTDPHLLAGIGNAYSDEILHAAKLSPFRRTDQLSDDDWIVLHRAIHETLTHWRDQLIAEASESFPEKVTAFRPEMAVHGRFGKPCPVCGSPVQRIVYAENESNYCATCQTGGRLLADRALSRLLHDDWPKTLEELDQRRNPSS